jgi:hypothetical protein
VCEIGEPLENDCSECATDVCATDQFCCNQGDGWWDYWCAEAVSEACGGSCDDGLVACETQYTDADIGGYLDCGGSDVMCTIGYNSTQNSCNEVCEQAGGECVAAYNDAGGCNVSNEQINCDFTGYNTAICYCSRGCGLGAPCEGGETCTDGACL